MRLIEELTHCHGDSLLAPAAEFTDRGMREMRELFDRAHGLLECARDLTRIGDPVLARHVEFESMHFQEVASTLG